MKRATFTDFTNVGAALVKLVNVTPVKLHGLTHRRGKATDLGAVADELDAWITGAD